MRRFISIISLLFLILTFSSPSGVRSQTTELSTGKAAPAQDRLILFEAFMRST